MSAGPWYVYECPELRMWLMDGKNGGLLEVSMYGITRAEAREWAYRIADRLNATEGDER